MAKGKALNRAPGFLIGQWKKEAIAANPAASDENLAKIINETAKKQGYDYTITPEKVRSKTPKNRGCPYGTQGKGAEEARWTVDWKLEATSDSRQSRGL